jgi:hypothetical protein
VVLAINNPDKGDCKESWYPLEGCDLLKSADGCFLRFDPLPTYLSSS